MVRPIDRDLNTLFTPQNLAVPSQLGAVGDAFQRLARFGLANFEGGVVHKVEFDPVAIGSFVTRFQRDAFGVHFFHSKIDRMAAERSGMQGAEREIKDALQTLSIRINSSSPRKTRIAAAFSLWLSTCKPFFLKTAVIPPHSTHVLQTLSGRINFYIATNFLSKFGAIELGEGEDKKERLDRIYYDLTFRELGLSSLELMYCSILRADTDRAKFADPSI